MKNKKKKNTFKNEKGTTLVEVMLSVALLAIIVTPLLGAVTSSVKNTSAAKDKTEAIALAQRVMGEIKAWKVIGTGSGDMPASSNGLIPCYEITLGENDKGKVVPSGSTATPSVDNSAYSYAAAEASDADFELEIGQATNTAQNCININFYKIDKGDKVDNNITKTNAGLLQNFSVSDNCLELKIVKLSDSYSYPYYIINTKVMDTDEVTKIGSGSFNDTTNGIIKLRVTYVGANTPSPAEQLKIFTNIISDTDNIFKVYVINNEEANSGINFINEGKKDFEVIYMDTTNVFDYSNSINGLYKINITIKKDSKSIYTTSSYVKK